MIVMFTIHPSLMEAFGWRGELRLLVVMAVIAIPLHNAAVPRGFRASEPVQSGPVEVPITGPLVNALLILSVEMLGVGPAAFVGMVTPLSALLHGVLPLPLMVMIPFIALGNMVLMGLYGALRAKNRWLALGVAAVAKFAWLYAAVTWLVVRPPSVLVGTTPQPVAMPASLMQMMQWPQLATALVGGCIAFAIQDGIRRLTPASRP